MQTFNQLNAFIYPQKTSVFYCFGGDRRERTGDLLLARQALSQLSYIPIVESSSVSLAAAFTLRLARSAASPLLAQTLRWFALGT